MASGLGCRRELPLDDVGLAGHPSTKYGQETEDASKNVS